MVNFVARDLPLQAALVGGEGLFELIGDRHAHEAGDADALDVGLVRAAGGDGVDEEVVGDGGDQLVQARAVPRGPGDPGEPAEQ